MDLANLDATEFITCTVKAALEFKYNQIMFIVRVFQGVDNSMDHDVVL